MEHLKGSGVLKGPNKCVHRSICSGLERAYEVASLVNSSFGVIDSPFSSIALSMSKTDNKQAIVKNIDESARCLPGHNLKTREKLCITMRSFSKVRVLPASKSKCRDFRRPNIRIQLAVLQEPFRVECFRVFIIAFVMKNGPTETTVDKKTQCVGIIMSFLY
jgi:hypothetical protein